MPAGEDRRKLPLCTELPRRVLLGNQASAKYDSRKLGFRLFDTDDLQNRAVAHSKVPLCRERRTQGCAARLGGIVPNRVPHARSLRWSGLSDVLSARAQCCREGLTQRVGFRLSWSRPGVFAVSGKDLPKGFSTGASL